MLKRIDLQLGFRTDPFLSYSPLCERIVSDWVVLVFYVFELHCCLIVFVLRLIRDFNSNPFDVRKS